MSIPSCRSSWPGSGRRSQQGQALVYGLFVLTGGLAALFYLFNTGQLIREKTKLVTTSDAVAYSAGVMNARALNFQAYTNRAMVANSVAIAQLVSLSSWVQYADNLANYGFEAGKPKFAAFYPSYFAAQSSGRALQVSLNETGALEQLAVGSDKLIRNVLMNAQLLAYNGLLPARQEVMDEVARANYTGDGSVVVEPVPLPSGDLPGFAARYSGEDRTRFKEVVMTVFDKDKFLPRRSWTMPALFPDGCVYKWDFMTRRGGTELIGFDQWQALDSVSVWAWQHSKYFKCFISERPSGWGGVTAADDPSPASDPTNFDSALLRNPGSAGIGLVTSDAWDYSGLPSFYDLTDEMRAKDDPRLQFAIRLRRDKAQTVTSEGRSDVRPAPRLNAYAARPAGGSDIVAVSASEVYFERSGDAKNNVWGEAQGKPHEMASLFNPYWQVHLIYSADAVRGAQGLQGAVMP